VDSEEIAASKKLSPNLEPSVVELDESQFMLCSAGLKPCRLGNIKQFYFLKVLAESVGRFVSFLDIAERMGGDDNEVDALPGIKFRLDKRLRNAEYVAIADAIDSTTGHYRLGFEGEIRMKS
jgi:hypothetical protein